jgi:hypothetical protein
MLKTGRAHAVPLVLLLCVLLGSGSVAAFSAPGASAGPLEGVTGPINEAIGAPVREVTETVTTPVKEGTETIAPPVKEITETVTQPVHEVTETVSPPVHEVTETVARPAREATEAVKAPVQQVTEKVAQPVKEAAEKVNPAVHGVTNTTGASSRGAAKSTGTVGRGATGTTTRTLNGTVGAVTLSTGPGPTSAGGGGDAASADRGVPADAVTPHESPGSTAASAAPDLGPGDDTFEVPSRDGSVRAPLPKWLAYVWPAIALAAPGLADFLGHWGLQSLSLALATGIHGTGSAGGFGVAGVHASSGRPEAASSSPFSKIPSALGHAFMSPHVPGSALAYLSFLALAVIAVGVAVRREIRTGRRQGPRA